MTRFRRPCSCLALAASAVHTACSTQHAAGGPFELDGVYAATDSDAGADSDPLSASGDIVRFHAGRYSVRRVPCAPAIPAPEAGAALPDLSIADGCTSFGSFAISADGDTLSMTDDATGKTAALPFQAQASAPVASENTRLGLLGGVSLGGGTDGGVSLATSAGSITSRLVSLYKAGGQLYKALPCSGQSPNLGSDTGAMIRTATATSFTCIQSKITFPEYDVPNGPSGPYCTSFSQPDCTAANYYGRRGVPFIYYTFVASGRAECGFEYQPGLASKGGQGNPRWSPYIRDTAGAYVYGVNADQHSGTEATVWCGVESSGVVQMKINGTLVNMVTSSGATTPLASKLSFTGQATHAFRVTGLAWPETMRNVAAAKANGTYFPAYTCQPMNQLGPVVYTNTMVCPGSSTTPSVPYITTSGGNARWTSGGDGYTLSPSSEASETESGGVDTDVIFAGSSSPQAPGGA